MIVATSTNRLSDLGVTNLDVLAYSVEFGLQSLKIPSRATQNTNLTAGQWAEISRIAFMAYTQLNQQYMTDLVLTQALIDNNLHTRMYWEEESSVTPTTYLQIVNQVVDSALKHYGKPLNMTQETAISASEWSGLVQYAFSAAQSFLAQNPISGFVLDNGIIEMVLNERYYVEGWTRQTISLSQMVSSCVDGALMSYGYSVSAPERTDLTASTWGNIVQKALALGVDLAQSYDIAGGLVMTQEVLEANLNVRKYFKTGSVPDVTPPVEPPIITPPIVPPITPDTDGSWFEKNKSMVMIFLAGAFLLAIFPGQKTVPEKKTVPEGDIYG
jgi:hypothetical protein